ncbi:hydroxymethylbilane synthase [Terrimonas sp. NA20]|uniref:Hydroxymethylbilane synthase n=1 Tax=Terrimonas ginsenosidimutans TaxID=2908004 RepID=A0ABS9KQK4_9BACT|nr:hydroxymethylbilane synthase [Terrimonas ginsenosidimutans]MCG2614606.1 hydroxymethylbilane synthase [Terrimonas ginsenosidimutans]
MSDILRIGTRESQLAVWQATQVSELLKAAGHQTELVYIKSEGDINLTTPLYEMGVQGIFTRSLDIALLNNKIDIAVHSMKDVPVVLPQGIRQAAVLKRASYKDLLVTNPSHNHTSLVAQLDAETEYPFLIATSSIRRKAQWLNRYPETSMDNLRGNVNTRLKKLAESNWHGAIFAAAGLERINLRPENSIELDWMLPAPAQGAILVVCRMDDAAAWKACEGMNDEDTAVSVKVERDFLKTLMGGCSTPISALATVKDDRLHIKGSILSIDGTQKLEVEKDTSLEKAYSLGVDAAFEILDNGGDALMKAIREGEKQH